MNDIKDRIDKVDDRIKTLVKKYPLVFATVLGAGLVIGTIAGAVIW